MLQYALCPPFVAGFLLYLNYDSPNLLSKLVVSSFNIEIIPGPFTSWTLLAIRFVLTAFVTLEGARMLGFLNICGFSTLIIASTYQTELLRSIKDSTNFSRLRTSLNFYDRFRINLQHGRIMMMNIFALFFYALLVLGIILAFCTIKLREKFALQFYIGFPAFFGLACALGDVAIPMFINCATIPVEWLRRVKMVVGGWSGPGRGWGLRVAKSRQVKWVELGVGDVKLYNITKETKSATLFLIINYTITLLLSINV